jgi:hypothetical protein
MIMALAIMAAVPSVWAQPSVYYLFEQKSTGNVICEPQAPNESWTRVHGSGAFEDANCSIPFLEE